VSDLKAIRTDLEALEAKYAADTKFANE